MRNSSRVLWGGFALALAFLNCLPAVTAPYQQPKRPPYPDINKGRGKKRGLEAKEKLSSELVILFDQIANGGDSFQYGFDKEHLKELFNLDEGSNPYVGVTISVSKDADTNDLQTHQAKIYSRSGSLVFADVPVRALERIAQEPFVLSVMATKAAQIPVLQNAGPTATFTSSLKPLTTSVKSDATIAQTPARPLANDLTGKGVIIGLIDTGIDWRHKDFINADGTSRILYLWDMFDGSFENSSGKIGTQPPTLGPGNAPGPGTLYTNKQINDALKGLGVVNSYDNFGHGTVTAGTAAGNGSATANGVPAGTYAGVAPEADLIIVKAADCGNFDEAYVLGTQWIARVAKERRQPVVINHSLGGHASAHDGNEPQEQTMNEILRAGQPGVAITVSAGNEGNYSLHASGRFGPRKPGQADVDGSPVEVVVSPQRTADHTWLNGYFDSKDDWGLVIRGSGTFLVDHLGRPFNLYIFKVKDELKVQLPDNIKEPDYFDALSHAILDQSRLAKPGEQFDRLWVPVPPGNYIAWGFGPTANVVTGAFDLYTPFYKEGAFTIGAIKRMMVASPGNAANVITVGSYDFRRSWENQPGGQTIYNLPLDNISDYSSPGGPRTGGVFKPEITAPARYAIASMSAAADPDHPFCGQVKNMGAAGWTAVTRDGKHMAWSGTSAAAPYVAGVVALMFQKNPNLEAAQIKQILIKSAKRDDRFVGPIPNPEWGYGKIDPSAALAATPASRHN